MPAYPIPAWLHPANTATPFAESFNRAMALKTQVAEEQARLDQQSAQASMAAQARASELAQRHAEDQQRIELSREQHQQMLGLQRNRLQQAQEQITMKANEMARKHAATQAYMQEIGDGSDPEAATRAMLKYGAAMGAPGAAMSGAVRAMRMNRPELPAATEETHAGQTFLRIPKPSGGYALQQVRQPAADPEARMLRMQEISAAEREIAALEKAQEGVTVMDKPTTETQKRIKANFDRRQKRIDEIEARLKELRKPKAATTSGTGTSTAASLGPNEVIRTTKDGRKVVYDKTTKKPLRYADEQPDDGSPDMGGD